jgi:hypothetical protein
MDGVMRAMYRDPSVGPQTMALGQVCRVTIALGDIHHTFRAGSRIEASWVEPQIGPNDDCFDGYPKLSIEDWHKKHVLWIE